jgi:hypothetical protein
MRCLRRFALPDLLRVQEKGWFAMKQHAYSSIRKQAVLDTLAGSDALTVLQIYRATEDHSIRPLLCQMAIDGLIWRVSRGVYAITRKENV